MEGQRQRRRVGVLVLAFATVLELLARAPSVRADKKKPGLFDFQTWKTPAGHQRDAVQQIAPHQLDHGAASTFAGPPRKLRVRIYADRDHQATVLRWQHGIRTQLDRVNRVVEPVFNVRFEVESLRSWDRSHMGLPLDTALDELRQLDPGQEVDWVIGLVTPFKGVATSIHQIGQAELLGRHFVLRGMDDEQESLALDRELNLLSPEERSRLYEDRKSHKETVMFLHEWGHTMGLLHEESEPAIMNPLYDARRFAFSYFEKDAVLLVLARRLAEPDAPNPEAAAMADLFQKAPATEGTPADRARLIELARHLAEGGRRGPVDPKASAPGASDGAGKGDGGDRRPTLHLPRPDVDTYNKIATALNEHRPDDAWTALAPLAERHPKDADVAALACPLVALPAHGNEARAICERAIASGADGGRSALHAAAAYLTAHDPTRAGPLITAALPRIAAKDTETWAWVTDLAIGAGALSTAETALASLPAGDEPRGKLARRIEASRMRHALPRGTVAPGVPVEGEHAYLESFEEAERAIDEARGHRDKLTAARGSAGAFRAAFPDTAGADLLDCECELAAGQVGAAVKLCQATVAKYSEATRALYLLGYLALRQGRNAEGEKQLKRAILLDPDDPGPWRELAHHYRAMRAKGRLDALEAQHQAILSSPLPAD